MGLLGTGPEIYQAKAQGAKESGPPLGFTCKMSLKKHKMTTKRCEEMQND